MQFVAELVGTFMLVFFGCGAGIVWKSGNINLVGAALTWAAVVTAIVYSIAHISGSHINPSASIALAAVGLFPWKQVPVYVLAQTLGAILASLGLKWLFGADKAVHMMTLPVGPNPDSDLNIMAWEIIVTFMLLLVVCTTAVDPRAAKGLGGVAIGAVVFVDVILAEEISGCSLNPARSFGPALVNNNFSKLWIYIISPTIGAVAATSLYHFLQISNEKETKEAAAKDVFSSAELSRHGHENPIYSSC
ncbi:Aquaporin NIP1-1 [Platanthera zijinensis]|uniref:Aquaporin NIP1-1 n=1 Tax=Platanthera zijinensis TaxID=2320716 RepID=A0AAP0GCP9_9ASPA